MDEAQTKTRNSKKSRTDSLAENPTQTDKTTAVAKTEEKKLL
jgi:hypothetical protein